MTRSHARRAVFGLAAAALLAMPLAASGAPAPDADVAEIRTTIATLFDALKRDDVLTFRSAVAPGFYSFDGGARFAGDELMRHIIGLHADGWVFEWNLGEPEIAVHGDTAWATWLNQGFVQDPPGNRKSVAWLESAVLSKDAGRWRILFFHSSRSK